MRWFVLISLLLLFGCAKNGSVKPSEIPFIEVFKEQSIFYRPIPENVEIDPASDLMISYLVKDAKENGFVLAIKSWTVPVYIADEHTERYDVKLTANWAPYDKLKSVPIPDYAEPDPSADGHMVVIDFINGCIYDFWKASYLFGKWRAAWANALPLNSDGIFPYGYSARGSGFELLLGVIWWYELELGEINHALIFSYDYTRAGGPVPPATESDGDTDQPWAIPEGALLQLDPSLDLTTLGLNKYEMAIARALQKYGMYCADDGGGVTLYAVNPISVNYNPYKNIFGDVEFYSLDKIPIEKFRVIKLPPQQNIDLRIIENGCNLFE